MRRVAIVEIEAQLHDLEDITLGIEQLHLYELALAQHSFEELGKPINVCLLLVIEPQIAILVEQARVHEFLIS